MSHNLPARALEIASIGLAACLLLDLGTRAASGALEPGTWWLIPTTLALGFLSADFASGAVHWIGDRFFAEDTPLVGATLIKPFREHHIDPQDIVRHGLLELHGNSSLPVVAILLTLRFLPDGSGAIRTAFDLWLLFFLMASVATNQFHKWAHAPDVSRSVRWLQRSGIILAPERHAQHHSGDFATSYCITSGALNPLLDRIDFFGRCERGIRAMQAASR